MTEGLSIIVPVLNEAAGILPFLDSLRPLREQGVEVLVVDGGSEDNTPALARPLADRVLASRPGRAIQMNVGAAEARHGLLLFLHADTRLPEGAADAVSSALATHAWGRFDVRLSGGHWLLRWIEGGMNWRSRLTGVATGDQAVFVRREVFEQVGGFPALPLMEDIVLSGRLRAIGKPACLRSRVSTSSRRWESQGIARTVLLMWRLRAAFFLGASPQQLVRRYYPQPPPSPPYIDPRGRVLLFARPPEPGRVKTRLAAAIGADRACAIYTSLLQRQIARLQGNSLCQSELWVTDRPDAAVFTGCGLPVYLQQGSDLGARMRHAAESALTRAGRVLLIGSDCPGLTPDYLAQALAALDTHDVVVGPAEDGGYVLLGLKAPQPVLFSDIPWSTARVLPLTLDRLRAHEISHHLLPELQDIDDVASLTDSIRQGVYVTGAA